MKRDKIVSFRVNSTLLEKVNQRIMSKTEVLFGSRCNYYTYRDAKRPYKCDKFTISDLLEEKLKEYLEEDNTS